MNKCIQRAGLLAIIAVWFATSSATAQSQPGIAGVWNMTVTVSQGTGNPVFTLKQPTDSTITGTYAGTFGEAPVTGKIKGNKITLTIATSNVTMTYEGTVEGNKMKGKVNLGEYGDGEFSGQKKE